VVDLLLSFVALDHKPQQRWIDAALTQLQEALLALAAEAQQHTDTASSSSSSSAGIGVGSQQPPQQPQQHQLLFLPPYDPQQLLRDQQLQEPGLLISQPGPQQQQQQRQPPVEAAELEELQLLFDEAEAEGREADDSYVAAASIAGLQQQQQANQAEAGAPAQQAEQQQGLSSEGLSARMSMSSRASSSHNLSLRWQLLHPGLMPEHLGVLCWCLGRLQFQPSRGWMQLLGEVLLLTVPAVSQEVLVDILVGCVATGYLPVGRLQEQLMVRVLECLPTMPPESLRRTCQALVALEAALVEYEQQPAALAALWQQQGQLTPAPAAAGSYSQHLLQHKPQIAAAVVHRQGIVLTGSTTAQLADVLAYVAAAEQSPSLEYMSAAVTRAVEKLPDGCPTPAVCRLLWALARMGFKPHPQLLHQLLAALQRGLHLLSSQDLADAGWALCTLRHRPGTSWLALYSKEVAAKAGYMEAQALTDTLWALACFAAQPDREWLKQVLLAVGSKAAAGELSQQNAAVVLWALQQLGFQPQQMAGGGSTQPQPATTGVQSAVLALTGVLQSA